MVRLKLAFLVSFVSLFVSSCSLGVSVDPRLICGDNYHGSYRVADSAMITEPLVLDSVVFYIKVCDISLS